MTNKLVVFINSLKVPQIKKILLYEIKFLVPNYSCLQNPWLGGYRPQIPFLSVLNWICWTPPPGQNSWVRHCIAVTRFYCCWNIIIKYIRNRYSFCNLKQEGVNENGHAKDESISCWWQWVVQPCCIKLLYCIACHPAGVYRWFHARLCD